MRIAYKNMKWKIVYSTLAYKNMCTCVKKGKWWKKKQL